MLPEELFEYFVFYLRGASAGASAVAASGATQNEKLTQQLIKEEEEAMAKYKVKI